jgi:hypothetical protein
MKGLITTLVMVLILLLMWGFFLYYTDSTSDVLVSSMTEIYDYSSIEEWELALDACDKFLDDWDRYSKIYGLYMESVCVHDIELSTKRCRGYIKAENKPLSVGESASILAHFKLMRENDRLHMINIF